ncbi:MAG: Na+/H+ antiporter subunit E [Anaerolineales bacterium]|nr:Na+/H+ antiporter subunit E [Anaerolineales bacterium]
MTYFMLNIALALAWAALTGNFNPANLIAGFALGYGALFVIRRALEPSDYFVKVWQVIGFVFFFLWELLLANLRVAHDVLTLRNYMKPRVIALPLDARTDAEITALAYFISLTPGTLSLDISTDRNTMFIHAMYAPDADALRREIKQGVERRLLRLMRGTRSERG